MRQKKLFRIISLALWVVYAPGSLLAENAKDEGIPAWFSAADIVLIAERNKETMARFAITEIWKASKPIQLSALPLGANQFSPERVLLLINIPSPDANPGANPQSMMTVREIPILDDSVTIDSDSHERRRYGLTELRVKLVLRGFHK